MRCQLYELAYELAWLQRRTNLEKQNNPPHFSQPKPNKTKQNNASERRRLRRKRPVEHDGLLKSTAMPPNSSDFQTGRQIEAAACKRKMRSGSG